MPAYIEITENLKGPTCGRDTCMKEESPEHWVSVKIGPAILKPLQEMLTALERVKGIEAEDWVCECELYEGDPGKCPACAVDAAITKGAKLLKAIEGRDL